MGGVMQNPKEKSDKSNSSGGWSVSAIIWTVLAAAAVMGIVGFVPLWFPEEWKWGKDEMSIRKRMGFAVSLVGSGLVAWKFVSFIRRVREQMVQWFRYKIRYRIHSWGKNFVSFIHKKARQLINLMAALALSGAFVLFVWLAYDTYSDSEVLSGNKTLAETLDVLKFYAYVAGGILLIWKVWSSHRRATALEKTASLGEKGNITERFKNAIEHLGNPSESIRMGGVYGLYHVVQESRGYADTVLKILCAHAKSIMAESGYTEKEKPSNEIAAILDVLFPTISLDKNQKIDILFERVDISGWHLQGATISFRNMDSINGIGVNLSSAECDQANLAAADLSKANLLKTDLWKAQLIVANLWKANLSGAKLREADLLAADLSDADLSAANLWGANLSEAILLGANLSRADLRKANLSEANLLGARVTAEQLLQATTLEEAQLDNHIHDEIMRHKPDLLNPLSKFLLSRPAEKK